MMLLKPFELRDHHRTGRRQRGLAVWESTCHEDLDKAPIGSGLFGPVIRSGGDQVVDHFSGASHALSRNPAAMSIAQQEAGCLGKLTGIGRLGNTDANEQQHGGNDTDSWTHGKLLSSTSPLFEHRKCRFVPAVVLAKAGLPKFAVSFFAHLGRRAS